MLLSLIAATLISFSASAATKSDFSGSGGVRLAEPITHGGPASQRFAADGEQKLTFNSQWNAALGGLFWYENAYFVNREDYPGALREQDAREMRIQNAYLDFKGENFSIRAGSQVVVWGETFGVNYADMVNPKDIRELLPIDQSNVRRAVPMANLKYVKSNYTIQGIFIPRAEFNILPLPGSDYAPVRSADLGFREIRVVRERHAKDSEWETGGRVSLTLEKMDLTAFYFDHYDRNPFYEIESAVVGGTLRLRERHEKMQSLGFSAASDLNGYVIRAEWVMNRGRQVPIVRSGSLDDEKVDEWSGVASIDFPTWRTINFSLQGSSSVLNTEYEYLLRDRVETFVGGRASVPLFTSSNLDTVILQSVTDGSQRLQSELMVPLRSNLETRFGMDLLSGDRDSTFGSIKDASRLYVTLKAYWDGFKEPKKSYSRF